MHANELPRLHVARAKIFKLLQHKIAVQNSPGHEIVGHLVTFSAQLNRIIPPGSLQVTRDQYKEASACLAVFMKVIGFGPSVIGAFIDLHTNLIELDRGNVPEVFKPSQFNAGRVDQFSVRRTRVFVASVLQYNNCVL